MNVTVTLADNLMIPQPKHTHEELKKAFDKIANKKNWKLTLKGVIEESEFSLVNEAAIYFAGSPLASKRLPNGKIVVRGAGYYNCIGA